MIRLAWADPGHRPEYEPLHEGASDDEASAHFDRQRAIKNDWQRGIRHGLSMGHLSEQEAKDRGYHPSGHETRGWQPLPHTLYHVTTNLPAVHEHGLRSRDELNQLQGKGLGGGESDTISYTEDPGTARDILHSMREFHDAVTGRTTPHQLMERARSGDMGSRPFEREMRESNAMNVDRVLRGKQHLDDSFTTQAEMDAKHGPGMTSPGPDSVAYDAPKGRVHNRWERDSTPDERQEDAAALYKHFSYWREHAGGHPDPLFFGTDVKGFAASDPAHHGIVKVHPKPGAQGYQMGSLGEWRSATGDNVEVDRSHDPHTAVQAALNEPGSREELIRHAEGTQDLYRPADGSSRPLCATHALHDEGWRRRMHEFARDVKLTDTELPEAPSMRGIGQGRCPACTEQQHELRRHAPQPQEFEKNRNRPGGAFHPEPNRYGDRGTSAPFTPLAPSLSTRENGSHERAAAGPPGLHTSDLGRGNIASRSGLRRSLDRDPAWFRLAQGEGSASGLPPIEDCDEHHPYILREHDSLDDDLEELPAWAERNYNDRAHLLLHGLEHSTTHLLTAGRMKNRGLYATSLTDNPKDNRFRMIHRYSGDRLQIHTVGTHRRTYQIGPGRADDFDRMSARVHPTQRIFGPTFGLDTRLWDGEKLRPEVRADLLHDFTRFCAAHGYRDWHRWAKVHFFGSEASEWTSPELFGNADFDTNVGIDFPAFRKANPTYAHLHNADIALMFTHQMQQELNDPADTFPGVPGVWDHTWFSNPDSWDIRKIRPYAAYDVTANEWVVKPPHLPEWSWASFPPAVRKALDAAASYAKDVLRLPEPQRTQQGAALFDAWHSDRTRAFSPHGEGWWDFANIREKFLDQLGIWKQLVDAKHHDMAGEAMSPADWSNLPFGMTAATDRWPPYLTERADEYGDVYPANESRHNPRGPVGTLEDAQQAGLVGPFFHGTSKRRGREIRAGGFRQPRLHNWEMANAGTAEEVDVGNTHRTFFSRDHGEALHFAQSHHGDDADVVTAYLHPDHIETDSGGGWYPSVQVRDVAHAMAIREPKTAAMVAKEYEGEVGNRSHITRGERGELPIGAVQHMRGARGEQPGEHRNRIGTDWDAFKDDIARNGIKEPIFITVDHGQEPQLAEGNHRRDAAVELGMTHIPAEVRYFGHAEHEGTVEERAGLTRQAASSRLERAWGSHDPGTLFGDAPSTSAPWPRAGRLKSRQDYDKDLVREVISDPEHHHMAEIDPRELHATQPSITRAGVAHYLGGDYERTGETFADKHNPGNRRPVVYRREDGQNLLLSGHHRATAALLQGRPLRALVIDGPWGPGRG